MRKYVLIDKATGKFMPNTSNLQEADVFDRDAFTMPNACYKAIEVTTTRTLKLCVSTHSGFYVQMHRETGQYIRDIVGTTTNLQNAHVFPFSDGKANALSLPVEYKESIIMT